MQALNGVALALWLAQVLAHVYKLWRKPPGSLITSTTLEVSAALSHDSTPKRPGFSGSGLLSNFIHAVVSGLCVVCFLGAANTLPYQRQRRSVGLDDRRKAEVAFGSIGAIVFGVISLFTWSGFI